MVRKIRRVGRSASNRPPAAGFGVQFSAEAPRAVKEALVPALDGLDLNGLRVGVVTHKPLAEALRWGVMLATDPGALPPRSGPIQASDPHARAVAEMAAELVSLGTVLEVVGYDQLMSDAGNWMVHDDHMDDIMPEVGAFVVLGRPELNESAVRADAAVLGMDADTLYRGRVDAALVRVIGMARHLRRGADNPVRIFVAADMDTPPESSALPGLVWSVEGSLA